MNKPEIIRGLAKSLRLPSFECFHEHISPGMSVEDSLITLLTMEKGRRGDALVKRRIRESGIPNGKTVDTFELTPSIPHFTEAQFESLKTCQFIKDNKNVCALGGQGTGKSHLMAAITREAINLGYTAKYIRVSDMLTMLHEASTEKRLSAMTKTILKYDLISLDELGYLTLNTRKSQLLFDIVAKRNEMGASIFVTSNFQFSQWTKFIGDTTLANALVGKLAGGSIVLNMNGEDYRLVSLRGGRDNG